MKQRDIKQLSGLGVVAFAFIGLAVFSDNASANPEFKEKSDKPTLSSTAAKKTIDDPVALANETLAKMMQKFEAKSSKNSMDTVSLKKTSSADNPPQFKPGSHPVNQLFQIIGEDMARMTKELKEDREARDAKRNENDLMDPFAGMEEQFLGIVQKTFDAIVEALVTEGRIELRNFGVFEVKPRAARKARNPRTGEKVLVAAKNVVTFKPGKEMEERVRQMQVRDEIEPETRVDSATEATPGHPVG